MSYLQNSTFALPEQQLKQQAFITRVYGWMAGGLALTALVAAYVASSRTLIEAVVTNRLIFYGLIGAELILVFGLSAAVNRLTPAMALGGFLLYAAINGVTLSVIFLVYTAESLASTFFITAAMFGSMALFGTVTKRDLTAVGSFMFMGLIGIIIASFVNFFLHSEAVYWITSYFGVFIFIGLTAYDAQKIKRIGADATLSAEDSGRASVMGALALYLDFINMFLFLLRIFGRRRD
ncbi:MAG: ybhL [Candidatus Acidoferrum typicum]|nr:ybhL [Candidatus Acidoferrum typicum]